MGLGGPKRRLERDESGYSRADEKRVAVRETRSPPAANPLVFRPPVSSQHSAQYGAESGAPRSGQATLSVRSPHADTLSESLPKEHAVSPPLWSSDCSFSYVGARALRFRDHGDTNPARRFSEEGGMQ